MDVGLLQGLGVLALLILSGVALYWAKANGYISKKNMPLVEKVERLIPVIAGLTKKLTELPDRKIDVVNNILIEACEMLKEAIETDGFIPEEEMKRQVNDALVILDIPLSDEDKKLIENVVDIIYLFMMG